MVKFGDGFVRDAGCKMTQRSEEVYSERWIRRILSLMSAVVANCRKRK